MQEAEERIGENLLSNLGKQSDMEKISYIGKEYIGERRLVRVTDIFDLTSRIREEASKTYQAMRNAVSIIPITENLTISIPIREIAGTESQLQWSSMRYIKLDENQVQIRYEDNFVKAEAMSFEHWKTMSDIERLMGEIAGTFRRWSETNISRNVYNSMSRYPYWWGSDLENKLGNQYKLEMLRIAKNQEIELVKDIYPLSFGVYRTGISVYCMDWPSEINRIAGRIGAFPGPAVLWKSGNGIYTLEGMIVAKKDMQGKMTNSKVISQDNLELRRAIMKRYGWERYKKENLTVIDTSKFGVLFAVNGMTNRCTVVEVEDGTVDPETGVKEKYFLFTPPNMKTAKEAIAWTFEMAEDEYDPLIET